MSRVLNITVVFMATVTIVAASLDISGWIKFGCFLTTIAGVIIASEIEWKTKREER